MPFLRNVIFRSVFLLYLLLVSVFVHAAPEVLLQSQTSWDGGKIAYPEGQAEITSFILRIEEGQTPRFHCHPVPTFGYVLKGTVEIETKDGNKTVLTQGESAIEVMRTVHRGRAVDGPVEIVVFYAGAVGVPNTVFPEDEHSEAHCR